MRFMQQPAVRHRQFVVTAKLGWIAMWALAVMNPSDTGWQTRCYLPIARATFLEASRRSVGKDVADAREPERADLRDGSLFFIERF
jgi:hypothetical protein